MADRIIEQVFLLAWVAISYGIIYALNRFVPRGFIIAQLLFVIVWGLLPSLGIIYLGFLHYERLPVYWVVASLIFLYMNILRWVTIRLGLCTAREHSRSNPAQLE